jgi:hypothetical protein
VSTPASTLGRALRVVQRTTGNVGRRSLGAILDRDDRVGAAPPGIVTLAALPPVVGRILAR